MDTIAKTLKNEFIYGGHLLSLGAFGIVWSCVMLLGERQGLLIYLLAYLTSQIVYNYDHLSDINKKNKAINHERVSYLRKTTSFQVFMYVLYIFLFFMVARLTNPKVATLASAIAIGGILYTVKMKKLTQKILGFKNVYVALFWAILGFLVPFYYLKSLSDTLFLVFILFVFIRWLINSTFFDIKDIESDRRAKLKTVPVTLGIPKTLMYLHILNIFSGLILFFAFQNHVLPMFALTLMIFPFYSLYYLLIVPSLSDQKLRKISYILVDGEYILWPLVLSLGKLILG